MNLDESAKALADAVARARAARDAAAEEHNADWGVVEGWLAAASDDRPAPRKRVRELVQEYAEHGGIGPRAVWQRLQEEGYPTAEQTVISWMRADADAGVLAQPGGRGTPYVPGPRFRLDR